MCSSDLTGPGAVAGPGVGAVAVGGGGGGGSGLWRSVAKKLPQCLWRPNSEKRVSAREEGGPARVPTGWRCTEHLREPLIVMGASESRGATRSGLWGLTVEELVQPGRPAS